MADNTTTTVQTGIGLPTILFLIFLTLRLMDKIDWPWYAVASPLIIPWVLILVFFAIATIFTGIVGVISFFSKS